MYFVCIQDSLVCGHIYVTFPTHSCHMLSHAVTCCHMLSHARHKKVTGLACISFIHTHDMTVTVTTCAVTDCVGSMTPLMPSKSA